MDMDHMHNRALHEAAEKHDLPDLECILTSNHCDVNSQDQSGRTPLHCVLDDEKFDDVEELYYAINLLKDCGADINLKDYNARTPLHYVFSTYVKWIPNVVTFCLRNFPDVDHSVKDRDGHTIFHMFVSDLGEDAKERDDLDEILQGREHFIEEFINGKIVQLSSAKIEGIVNSEDNSGYSAFQTYIGGDFYSISTIKLFIQNGADVNSKSFLGNTALMKSVFLDRFDISEILLQAGADPNATNIFEQTALFHVKSNRSFLLLSDYGAKLDAKDRFGKIALNDLRMFVPEDLPFGKVTLASEFSKFKPLAEMFFQRGFSPNIKDRHGATLLHYASWWADKEAIQGLLRHGASIDERDSEGRTAYDLAVYHGHFDAAQLILPNNVQSENDAFRRYKESTKYARIAIHHAQTDDMDYCLKMLGYSDDASELITLLLESPVFGMTSRRPEAIRVKEAIDKLMIDVASKVSEMDDRFRCTVRQSGSAAEGTKTCDPCEFDYVFCLDYFAEECDVVQPDELLCSGFGYLRIKNNSNTHSLSPFLGSKGFIGSATVRQTFEDYVVTVLSSPEMWRHENIYFDGLCKFPSDKPVLQVQVEWFGSVYKQLCIDIDIVTGMSKEAWYPREITESGQLSNYSDFFILFHGPSDSTDLVRISSSPSEIGFLKESSEFVRECYSLAKILKSQTFCPLVQFDDSDSSEYSPENSDEEYENENDSDDNDDDEDDDNYKEIDIVDNEDGYTIYLDSSNSDNCKNLQCAYNDNRSSKLVQSVYGWLVHVDESRRVRKIYTPKIGSEDEIPNKQKLNENTPIVTSSKNELKNETKEKNSSNTHHAKHTKATSESFNYDNTSSNSGQRGSSEGKSDEPGLETKKNVTDDIEIIVSGDHDNNVASHDMSHSLTTHSSSQEQKLMEENNLNDDISWKGGDLVEAQDEITSYMLKNCIMYVLAGIEMEQIDVMSYKNVVINVYKYLLECAERRCLPAVCMPFINILSHVDEHIKRLKGKELEDVVEKRCFLLMCFCKVILGILRQNTKLKDPETPKAS